MYKTLCDKPERKGKAVEGGGLPICYCMLGGASGGSVGIC